MKKRKLLLSGAILIAMALTGINACSNSNAGIPDCIDGIKNGNETEVDCGGSCSACPPQGILSATVLGQSYTADTILGHSNYPFIVFTTIGSSGSVNFSFLGPAATNTPTAISYATFSGSSGLYQFYSSSGDSGTVILTSVDTIRKIISGNFSFICTSKNNGTKGAVQNGQFTNVRY